MKSLYARQILEIPSIVFLNCFAVMAHSPKDENKGDLPKKRTIEFDMFVRDLEPEEDEKIRGGGGSGKPGKPGENKDARN